MTDRSPALTLRWPVAIGVAIALVAGGAGVMWVIDRSQQRVQPSQIAPAPSPPAAGAPTVTSGEIVVTLSPELAARAGIQVASVSVTTQTAEIRIPAVVDANAYKQVTVTPLAAGRITRVQAELGQQVVRGQAIAEIYSPELARAQTAYLSARATLEAARQRLKRTERLAEIGAASRQELEEVRADETRLATELEGARSTLILLGMTPARVQQLSSARQMTATFSVPAPVSGVVTERQANVGLNVEPTTPLFTVVDLSTVWVVGDVYERDFGKVRVGSAATVTTDAYPDLRLSGHVSYIDPQVSPQTRTAKVRVEVPNRDRLLRLGMYASLSIGAATSRQVITIPREAVQAIGDRQVVYVVDPKQQHRFIERSITIADTSKDTVQVSAGLSPGDVVVTDGSFLVRSERERINPVSAPIGVPSGGAPASADTAGAGATHTVEITDRGFEPDRVTVPRGQQSAITFIRRTDNTCAKEVVIPSQNIRRELPLNQPVTIRIAAPSTGDVSFVCGMNMLKGVILVQ